MDSYTVSGSGADCFGYLFILSVLKLIKDYNKMYDSFGYLLFLSVLKHPVSFSGQQARFGYLLILSILKQKTPNGYE